MSITAFEKNYNKIMNIRFDNSMNIKNYNIIAIHTPQCPKHSMFEDDILISLHLQNLSNNKN
jgi:hypothetical protein